MAKTLVSQIYNAEPSLGNPTTDGYVLSSTTTGIRSWTAVSGGGVTPVSGILSWNSGTNKYEPYSSQSAGVFDNSNTNPIGSTRLNYNGWTYATKVHAINTTDSTWAIYGAATSGVGVWGQSGNTGYGVFGSSTGNVGILAETGNGTSLIANIASGGTALNIIKAQKAGVDKFIVDKDGNVNIASGATYKINSVDIVHSPVTLGTENGLSIVGQVLSLGVATSSNNGALTSDDWTTFNSKEPALGNPGSNG